MDDVFGGPFVDQQVKIDVFRILSSLKDDLFGLVEIVEDLLGGVAQGPEQNGHGQLASPVDRDIEESLGVELQVQPGPAMGNDPGGVEGFARVGLALVMFKEDAGRAMELADDDPSRSR